MTFKTTMMMTAAAVILTATAAAAEGSDNLSEQYNYNQEGASMDSASDAGVTTKSSTSSAVSEIAPAAGVDAATPAQADMALSSSTVQNAQTSLKEEGYTVSVDGVWGPQTAAALREFQQEKGLSATGRLNAETLAALDIRQ